MDDETEPEPDPAPCTDAEYYRWLIRGYQEVTGDQRERVRRLEPDTRDVIERNGELFVVRTDLTIELIGPMPSEGENRDQLETLRKQHKDRIWGRKGW